MPSLLEQAGAAREQSSFAPLHTDRMFTGYFTNRSVLRDGASTEYQVRYGGGRMDAILEGQNTELSSRLTLIRRPGSKVYNSNPFPAVKSFYSFHTFTLTDEAIEVLADTQNTIYRISHNGMVVLMNKGTTNRAYFLGVGNILYITDGVENKQWIYNPTTGTGTFYNWGIAAPTTAPTVSQALRPNPYGSWLPNTGYTILGARSVTILDSFASWQQMVTVGLTGSTIPSWSPATGGITQDNQVQWKNIGVGSWQASHAYTVGQPMRGAVDPGDPSVTNLFWCIQAGTSGAAAPGWIPGLGNRVSDGGVVWENGGVTQLWSQQVSVTYQAQDTIVDSRGFIQKAVQYGRTGATVPNFSIAPSGATQDGTVLWQNQGAFAVSATAAVQYGYAYESSITHDVSNMSPASAAIVVIVGNQVTVQGVGSGDPQVDLIPIYRTAQGGSDFLLRAKIPNPGAGVTWTYVDNDLTAAALNPEIQAQVSGEGTPLPAGAGAMAYHLGRIFVAVGNVVWVSSGPDAAAAGSSGNAGFDQFFTLQSKITRFWVNPLGLVVFTIRDSYIFQGTATDADPLYVSVWIPNLPLLSYDCFCEYMTAGYLYTGQRVVKKLDPGAGILDISFPIADQLEMTSNLFDPAKSYLTFHSEGSNETALYLSNNNNAWLRMSATSSPETGSNWNVPAVFSNSISAVQSVEVDPGVFRLLIAPGPGLLKGQVEPTAAPGPILERDRSKATDNGATYAAYSVFGSITLCEPGQIAGLAFLTFDSTISGTRPALGLLIGEISGTFEPLARTRQDPPLLPPAKTIRGDRYYLLQDQRPVWCRHFQFRVDWPAEDAFNELLAFTIFGEVRQERGGA